MPGFSGFPSQKGRPAELPEAFFSELLPQIDHLGELKLTLFALWALSQPSDQPAFITLADCLAEAERFANLANPITDAVAVIADAVERAVIRGTLLRVAPPNPQPEQVYLFLNDAAGQQAAEDLAAGRWQPAQHSLPTLTITRPNIYRLYEQNIGPLTPLIADALRDAEAQYPPEWIAEAIQIAVERNARNWKYIQAILRSWKEKGRDEPHQRDAEPDYKRYVKGKYGDIGER